MYTDRPPIPSHIKSSQFALSKRIYCPTMLASDYKFLSVEQRKHFLEHGWIRIPKAVSPGYIQRFTEDVWIRLGYDPDDKATWKKEKVRPCHSNIVSMI